MQSPMGAVHHVFKFETLRDHEFMLAHQLDVFVNRCLCRLLSGQFRGKMREGNGAIFGFGGEKQTGDHDILGMPIHAGVDEVKALDISDGSCLDHLGHLKGLDHPAYSCEVVSDQGDLVLNAEK